MTKEAWIGIGLGLGFAIPALVQLRRYRKDRDADPLFLVASIPWLRWNVVAGAVLVVVGISFGFALEERVPSVGPMATSDLLDWVVRAPFLLQALWILFVLDRRMLQALISAAPVRIPLPATVLRPILASGLAFAAYWLPEFIRTT